MPCTLYAQNETSYCNRLQFKLPFQIDAQEAARLQEAQLYESLDGKTNWRLIAKIGPGEKAFPVQVNREGEYWFLLRTIETGGQAFPPSLDRLPVGVQVTRIIVDTTPPRMDFREVSTRGDQVTISWNIVDEYLDPSTINLDYLNSNNQWMPISIRQQARGETTLNVPVRGRLELRLSAADGAKNLESRTITVNTGGTTGGGFGNEAYGRQDRDYTRGTGNSSSISNDGWDTPRDSFGGGRRSESYGENTGGSSRETRFVNSETFHLNFHLEEVGPSGAYVEAFYQADKEWTPAGNIKVNQEGPGKLKVTLPREGHFGMILQVRSGFDNTASKPRTSTSPDMWICVDKTPPKVMDVQALPGRGVNMGKVKITWRATDPNLAQQPIKIEYRDLEDNDKSWQLLADGLDNSGSYIWQQVPTRGYRYQIRVSALDKARNWGEQISQEVIVDVAQPKVRIIDIDP
ncbi:MAG TPA: hypothetical protein PKD72_07505 [Gemmatales bacterium]|nr:hypothetical protein [Gemmatales bacterium]